MPHADPLENVAIAALRIVHYPDPVLRKRARPVEHFGPRLGRLAARMLELMHKEKGVGLAAPQVGLSMQLFVCNATGEPRDDLVCVNPSLHDPDGQEEKDEGCLSITGVSVPMRRAVRITLRACDATGSAFERRGEQLLARVWQHETDHLFGRLIIDSMSEAVRLENRRAIKQLEDDYVKAQGKAKWRPAGKR